MSCSRTWQFFPASFFQSLASFRDGYLGTDKRPKRSLQEGVVSRFANDFLTLFRLENARRLEGIDLVRVESPVRFPACVKPLPEAPIGHRTRITPPDKRINR